VPALFYIRLISFTAGTLVYLFLLALILGHRRPRLFERLLFCLVLSLFLIYAGGLLEINAKLEYVSSPAVATQFAWTLVLLGTLFLQPLVLHTFAKYTEQVRLRHVSPIAYWLTWIFYALPFFCITWFFVMSYKPHVPLKFTDFVDLWSRILPEWWAFSAVFAFGWTWGTLHVAVDTTERELFRWLAVSSTLLAVGSIILAFQSSLSPAARDLVTTCSVAIGVVPGVALLYYSVRKNFLEFGAQRNLMYALPVTFLAVLYLALVRRVGVWLEPVMPPEATAAVLLFSLIFLFEPLERVIGPVLHRRFQEGLGGVQRLSIELQQEARQGNVTRLILEAEGRIREEFGLAAVRITLRPSPALPALEAPGGLGHTAAVRLIKDGQEIGLLEAASTGSYLTGETTAALGFLGEQLPGMIDLARLIEDKVRLERELAERERMASLGQMAANVSHNLRNPLSSMKTVLQVQLEDPDLPVNVRRDSTLVVSEIDRMSAKLSQLLRYAKPSVSGQRVAAVALANQTAVLFRHDAERRNVRFEFERPTEEIFALASEEALSEILSNLIVNAIEAQADGGRVKVGLARSNGRLEIMVEDGGPGISQELREKMFQPYFTTKPAGTGLGLSIVARRVEEMSGTISCESPVRNGKGTRFRLTLPLAAGEGS
jgi:signal transduction histidine kinase